MGADRDQNYLAPENVLTSAMKRVDSAIYQISEMQAAGNFPGGETFVFNLENEGVGVAPTSDMHVPADLLAEVDEIADMIIAGDIQVPRNAATFAEYGFN